MHFLPDVYVPCEQCHGRRYNRETLEVRFKGKRSPTCSRCRSARRSSSSPPIPKIHRRLQTLHDVGLDYIRLGQPATTLSGGEAQRVKLATELSKVATGDTLYILDEPTTGLHFADVERLLEVLGRLVDQGNTVVVIEHNLDVIKSADRLIDLGPEGGEAGGEMVAVGTPRAGRRRRRPRTPGEFLRDLVEAEEPAPKPRRTKAKPRAGRGLSRESQPASAGLGCEAELQRPTLLGAPRGLAVALAGGDDRALHQDVPLAREASGSATPASRARRLDEAADVGQIRDPGAA